MLYAQYLFCEQGWHEFKALADLHCDAAAKLVGVEDEVLLVVLPFPDLFLLIPDALINLIYYFITLRCRMLDGFGLLWALFLKQAHWCFIRIFHHCYQGLLLLHELMHHLHLKQLYPLPADPQIFHQLLHLSFGSTIAIRGFTCRATFIHVHLINLTNLLTQQIPEPISSSFRYDLDHFIVILPFLELLLAGFGFVITVLSGKEIVLCRKDVVCRLTWWQWWSSSTMIRALVWRNLRRISISVFYLVGAYGGSSLVHGLVLRIGHLRNRRLRRF